MNKQGANSAGLSSSVDSSGAVPKPTGVKSVLKPTKKRKYDAFDAAEPSVSPFGLAAKPPRGAKPPAAKPLPSYSDLTNQNESLNRMISDLQARNQDLEQTALKIYLQARDVGAEPEIPDIAKKCRVRYSKWSGLEYRHVQNESGSVSLLYHYYGSKWILFPEGLTIHHAVQDVLNSASWFGQRE